MGTNQCFDIAEVIPAAYSGMHARVYVCNVHPSLLSCHERPAGVSILAAASPGTMPCLLQMSAADPSANDSVVRVIGLMSGTSRDGVDAAVILTDGDETVQFGPSVTVPYDSKFRGALTALIQRGLGPEDQQDDEVQTVEAALTDLHTDAVKCLLESAGLERDDVHAIGFHGHTIYHAPERGLSWQLGDARRLARDTGIPVVHQFRSEDVKHGGQGAPLAPVYHRALCLSLMESGSSLSDVAFLNLGGVSNVTFLERPGASPIAFDLGPGCALLDDYCAAHTKQCYDTDGALALAGEVAEGLLARWLEDPYFRDRPPKSLDRDHFQHTVREVSSLSAADGAATLTAFTGAAVEAGVAHLPRPPRRWLVCGGGRRNPAIIAELRRRLSPGVVEPVERCGWDGDAMEAQLFGYLAVRSLRGLPISFPTTTGCPRPMTGGEVVYPATPAP